MDMLEIIDFMENLVLIGNRPFYKLRKLYLWASDQQEYFNIVIPK